MKENITWNLRLICVSSRRLVQDSCPYIGFIFISSNNPQPQKFRTWSSWVLHPFLSQLGGLDFFYQNVLLKVTVVKSFKMFQFRYLGICLFFFFFWPPQTLIYDTYENVKLTKTIWSNYSILKYQIYRHLIEEDKFKSNETYSKVVLRNGARAPNL